MEEKLEPVGAIFSPNRIYRYALWRIWNSQKGFVAFVGLNPSTANETKNDPTIRRVIGFAQDWGFGGVLMFNLFGLVTPLPRVVKKHPDPFCQNDAYLRKNASLCREIVFAWGSFEIAKERGEYWAGIFPNAKCLGHNRDGSPKHPLYVPKNTVLVPFCKKK